MVDNDLITRLREHAEWAKANEWETPIMLGNDLDAAARIICYQETEIQAFRNSANGYKALEDAPTVDAADVLRNQWISVKDRLPEENENCLFISSANNSVYIGRYICTGKKGAVKFEKRDGRGTVLYTASHWMLLPEPPEEDKP